jgi:hypothetical protein
MKKKALTPSISTLRLRKFPDLFFWSKRLQKNQKSSSFKAPSRYRWSTTTSVTRLRNLGYSVALPPLPSCSDVDADDFPKRTLTDDADVVTRIIEQLVEDGKMVIVVMHSYGGIVGSKAIPKSLSYTARQERGEKGGVIHLFYYTAFLLEKGEVGPRDNRQVGE